MLPSHYGKEKYQKDTQVLVAKRQEVKPPDGGFGVLLAVKQDFCAWTTNWQVFSFKEILIGFERRALLYDGGTS